MLLLRKKWRYNPIGIPVGATGGRPLCWHVLYSRDGVIARSAANSPSSPTLPHEGKASPLPSGEGQGDGESPGCKTSGFSKCLSSYGTDIMKLDQSLALLLLICLAACSSGSPAVTPTPTPGSSPSPTTPSTETKPVATIPSTTVTEQVTPSPTTRPTDTLAPTVAVPEYHEGLATNTTEFTLLNSDAEEAAVVRDVIKNGTGLDINQDPMIISVLSNDGGLTYIPFVCNPGKNCAFGASIARTVTLPDGSQQIVRKLIWQGIAKINGVNQIITFKTNNRYYSSSYSL